MSKIDDGGPRYGEGCLTPEQRNSIFRGRDRDAVMALARIYGEGTDDILNALHSLAARIAIASEVDPTLFAHGLKLHWDVVVRFLENESAARKDGQGGGT